MLSISGSLDRRVALMKEGAMAEPAEAASVIGEVLDRIAEDPLAMVVADALRLAWDGNAFDQTALQDALASLPPDSWPETGS